MKLFVSVGSTVVLLLACGSATNAPPQTVSPPPPPPAEDVPPTPELTADVPADVSARNARRARDEAIEAWDESQDLGSHLRFLRTLDPVTDANCRNPEMIGATVAEQVDGREVRNDPAPGYGVSRELGCSHARCRIRKVAYGPRRLVGLEIFYTRQPDGTAAEVDCYSLRGG